MSRNINGAALSAWPSCSWRSINKRRTCFHRNIWLRKLHNPTTAGDPLWIWVFHLPLPAATACCMWRVVDGEANLHRLPHAQCDVWSVGTRQILQRAPWRRRSWCDQHGGAGRLRGSQLWHIVPCTRFSILGCGTNISNNCRVRM